MQYIAFFRGINVGGRNSVRMADLRRLFVDCGFANVRTYIQSGNVLFETAQDPHTLPARIADAFLQRFGFASAAVVYSADALAALLAALPFSPDEIAQAEAADPAVEHVYVYLSGDPVDSAAIEALQCAYDGKDRLAAGRRAVYLLCYRSVRHSRLAAALARFDTSLTARNLKTLRKLPALAADAGKEIPQ